MNKYDYLFGFGTEGAEKVFADSMFAVIVIAVLLFVLGKKIAAAKERKQEQQVKRPVAQAFGNAVKQANPSVQAAQYAFDAARAMTAASLELELGSAEPPSLMAMAISRAYLVKILAFLASAAPLVF